MAYINGHQILQIVSTVGGGGGEVQPLVELGYTSGMKLQYDGEYRGTDESKWQDISGYGYDMTITNHLWGFNCLIGNGSCKGTFPTQIWDILARGANSSVSDYYAKGYTLEAVVKTSSTIGVDRIIFGAYDNLFTAAACYGMMDLQINSNNKFYVYMKGGLELAFGTTEANTFYDIVITCDGLTMNFYVNGELAHTVTAPTMAFLPLTRHYFLQTDARSNSGKYWDGNTYAFLAYDKVLTAEEISNHYTLNQSRYA